MPPTEIYKVTLVYSLSRRACLYHNIDVISLPQPRDVQFKHTAKKGDVWEELVWWFWSKDKAEECLMNARPKHVYNQSAWTEEQKKALAIRIKNADKELKRLKKEREMEKRIEQ